jgi:hypothetical protein
MGDLMRSLIIDPPGVFDDDDEWRKFLAEMHRRRKEVTHIDDAMEVDLWIARAEKKLRGEEPVLATAETICLEGHEMSKGLDQAIFSDFVRALAFASHKHSQQRRKDEESSPYINHPIALVSILATASIKFPIMPRTDNIFTVESTLTQRSASVITCI